MGGSPLFTRRWFLTGATAATALASCGPVPAAQPAATATPLPPPETTTLRLPASFAACDPYFWLADDFLREEGFTDARRATPGQSLLKGEVDVNVLYANQAVANIDAGLPLVALAGGHVGCLELWARTGIDGIRDLRGKRLVVDARSPTSIFYGFFVSMLTSVGVDPNEVNWLEDPNYTTAYFIDGKVDAFLAATTSGHFIKTNPANPGRLILDTAMDKPWSQYYCCLIVANRDWARRNPAAAKRFTRAILRANDVAAKDPALAARTAIEKKLFGANITYDILHDFLKRMPFTWREYDPEETLRFYSLRLADAKLIKKTPQQILNEGADLAYFRLLRKELKA